MKTSIKAKEVAAPVSNKKTSTSHCNEHYRRCSEFSNLFLARSGIQNYYGETIRKLSWKSDLLANPPSTVRML